MWIKLRLAPKVPRNCYLRPWARFKCKLAASCYGRIACSAAAWAEPGAVPSLLCTHLSLAVCLPWPGQKQAPCRRPCAKRELARATGLRQTIGRANQAPGAPKQLPGATCKYLHRPTERSCAANNVFMLNSHALGAFVRQIEPASWQGSCILGLVITTLITTAQGRIEAC